MKLGAMRFQYNHVRNIGLLAGRCQESFSVFFVQCKVDVGRAPELYRHRSNSEWGFVDGRTPYVVFVFNLCPMLEPPRDDMKRYAYLALRFVFAHNMCPV